jgi:hypothetical protein
MLNKGNLLCFDWVMRNLPSKNPIIEIGSFCGLCRVIEEVKQRSDYKLVIQSPNYLFPKSRKPAIRRISNCRSAPR